MNITDSYQRYLHLCRKSPSSISQYVNDVKLFCRIVKIDPLAGTGEDVEKFIEALIQRQYENSSILRKIASLRSFYRFLLTKNLIKHFPLDNIPRFKLHIKEQKILSVEEVKLIFEFLEECPGTLKGRELNCIFRVFYFLGLRVSELVNLNLSSIAFSSEKSLSFTAKGNKKRTLPLVNSSLIAALNSWVEFRKKFPGERLFLNTHLRPLSVRTAQRWIKWLGINAGLGECLTPHVIRRTFATHLLENGADIFSVSDLLGHLSLNATQRYAKVTEKRRRETLLLLK